MPIEELFCFCHILNFITLNFLVVMFNCLDLKYFINITTKLFKDLLQKRKDNYFRFVILCHLNKKISLKAVAEKIVYICICLFFCPKSLKLPSGLTKLCIFINKGYDTQTNLLLLRISLLFLLHNSFPAIHSFMLLCIIHFLLLSCY